MSFLKFIFFVLKSSRRYDSNTRVPRPDRPVVYRTDTHSPAPAESHIQNFPMAKVKWVVDGDTVIVVKGWNEITIRLDSIDCPEDGQHWGDTAKYGLMKIISKKNIHLEDHGVDVHGRTLATLYVWHSQKNEWINVNERMVMLGHAWVMRRHYSHLSADRQDKLNRLEWWAKSKRVGLWHEQNPTPPWEWRSRV